MVSGALLDPTKASDNTAYKPTPANRTSRRVIPHRPPLQLTTILALLPPGREGDPKNETTPFSTAPPPLDTAGLPPDHAAAKYIIHKAVLNHGPPVLPQAAFKFRFRDRMYRYQRTAGAFTYERWWIDTTTLDTMRDMLHNDGLVRFANGVEVALEEKKAAAYGVSVNSVV